MNRRRVLAAVFFSVVIVAVLGVIVGAEIVSGGQTVTVLRLRSDVSEGAVFSTGEVEAVPLRIAPGDVNYEAPGSVPAGARFAVPMRAGDLLGPDDLIPAGAEVEISLTITGPPPVTAGQSIDVFASLNQSQLPIGHAMPVVDVSGSQLTVLVPSRDELAWVEIAASTTPLHAVVSVASSPEGFPASDVAQAICQLSPADCAAVGNPAPTAAAGSAGVATPSPTPSP
ncbi:MAG: hypothetical protein ACLQT7_01570 [Candidatus Dormibacteria bacterium]